jgi:protein-tyrosine phosphatase
MISNFAPTASEDRQAGVPNFYENEKETGFVYKRIPIFDNRGENLLPHLDGAVKFIEQGVHHTSVLCHCYQGVSRSASVILAYLIRSRGMTLEAALEYLKGRRPCVKPRDNFLAQLKQYEKRVIQERADAKARGEPDPNFPNDLLVIGSNRPKQESRAASMIGPATGPQAPNRSPGATTIGPAIGPPIGPAIGPPIGPAIGPRIGPAVSPPIGPAIGPVIGPVLPPTAEENSSPSSCTKKRKLED